ncbi:solute carrier family 2, facilitated glucose transporter member 3-like [Paramacrobiotus metropolitanus]|uniref:solute carrier family 2, facilitated glucose transporter member 3-like n=1 Tax=Paramacrobiotus metropolitanus TaxID=2943436 RepID=UPI002446427A|nr:solute carrier family 2, facilitated glucose transporter member 3-like [Paramacrobiotus metropolitanus]
MESGGCTLRLLYLVFTTCFGNNFQMGYLVTSVNVPQFVILRWIRQVRCNEHAAQNDTLYAYNQTDYNNLWCREISPGDEDTMLAHNTELSTLWAIIGSVLSAGAFVGVWPSSLLLASIGNKNSIYLVNIIAVLGTVACSLCTAFESVTLLIVGRFLLGLFHGLIGIFVPVYIAEVSPVKFRGAMQSAPVITFNLGMLTAILVSLPNVLGNEYLWSFITWTRLIGVVFTFATLPFCPESPVYLLSKRRHEEARHSLQWLRNTDKVEEELNEIQLECDRSAEKASVSMIELFETTILRKTLYICVMAMVIQQLTGFSVVITFSTSILANAGLDKTSTLYGSISLVGLQNLGAVLSMFLVERAGRRLLFLIGCAGCAVSCLGLVIFIQLSGYSSAFAYGSLSALLIFMLSFSLGVASVPWIWPPELFPANARGVGMIITTAFCYLGSLVTIFVAPIAEVIIGEWIFAVFAGCTVVGVVYMYFASIETKGKPFEMIDAELRKKFGLGRDGRLSAGTMSESGSQSSRC